MLRAAAPGAPGAPAPAGGPAPGGGGGGGGGGGDDEGGGAEEQPEVEQEESESEGEAVSGEMFGALERRNPLPTGRYWIDATSAKAPELEGYFQSNSARIHVETTEGAGETEGTIFYIFSVLAPVPWFATNFGFPTVAGPEIKSKSDTATVPDLPPDAAETGQRLLAKAGTVVELVGLGIGVLIGLKLLEAFRSKKQ
jgi:hypothetical protein